MTTTEEGMQCGHCERTVSVDNTVMLTDPDDKQYWKYLCPECLEEQGVPPGLEIERDLTYVKAGTEHPTAEGPADPDGNRADTATIADFTGQVLTETMTADSLQPGRVVMNKHQLVLVAENERTIIPLSRIDDVIVRRASPDVADTFDDVVTLKFRDESEGRLAFVASEKATIERFRGVLFRALLIGTPVRFEHPARIGGRQLDTQIQTATLEPGSDWLTMDASGSAERIPLDAVVAVERTQERREGERSPLLTVHYWREGTEYVSEIVATSKRKLHLLSRYLRLDLRNRRHDIDDIDLSDRQVRVLATLYAGIVPSTLPEVLAGNEESIEGIWAMLRDWGLVTDETPPVVTRDGLIVLTDRFDEVVSADE